MFILIFLISFSFFVFRMQDLEILLLMNKEETTMFIVFLIFKFGTTVDNYSKP